MHMHTCIYISPQLVHARPCNGAADFLPWKLLRTYLESCTNIVQAVVSAHPPAPSSSRQPSCSPVARHVRLRNPIKSTLSHDAVAAVMLHKHHLIIRAGAGLIQFVYGSHSRLAADLTLDKTLFSLPFSRGFSNWSLFNGTWSSYPDQLFLQKCAQHPVDGLYVLSHSYLYLSTRHAMDITIDPVCLIFYLFVVLTFHMSRCSSNSVFLDQEFVSKNCPKKKRDCAPHSPLTNCAPSSHPDKCYMSTRSDVGS